VGAELGRGAAGLGFGVEAGALGESEAVAVGLGAGCEAAAVTEVAGVGDAAVAVFFEEQAVASSTRTAGRTLHTRRAGRPGRRTTGTVQM
jgi:hypothetical protein